MDISTLNKLLEQYLYEMTLEVSPITDLREYIHEVLTNFLQTKRTKYMIPNLDIGIPADTIRHIYKHHNKTHNLSIRNWYDLFDNIFNITAAKQGNPNSYGTQVYVLCIKGILAYYYVVLNVNKQGNLLSTVSFQNINELDRYFPQNKSHFYNDEFIMEVKQKMGAG